MDNERSGYGIMMVDSEVRVLELENQEDKLLEQFRLTDGSILFYDKSKDLWVRTILPLDDGIPHFFITPRPGLEPGLKD